RNSWEGMCESQCLPFVTFVPLVAMPLSFDSRMLATPRADSNNHHWLFFAYFVAIRLSPSRISVMSSQHHSGACRGLHRRAFLSDVGMGFTGLALGAMLARDGVVRANPAGEWQPPDGQPHFEPKAKSVIWLFMNGGMSHMESFDPKPELTTHAGKTI